MAIPLMHEVAETATFLRQLDRLGVSEVEHDDILDNYQSVPDRGDIIRGSGGIRKGRTARENGGKSGGYRIFSFYINRRAPVFLLWIIAKSRDDNVTDEQLKAFAFLTRALKEIWSKR